MNSNFLNGFVDELTKEAGGGHPLFTSVKKGGTLLGRRVRGMMARAMEAGKRKSFRMKKKADAETMELKPTMKPPKPLTPPPTVGDKPKPLKPPKPMPMDARYGGGSGNFEGKQAPAFTADTKKGKIGNPSENPQNFGKKAALQLRAQKAVLGKARGILGDPKAQKLAPKQETDFGFGATKAPAPVAKTPPFKPNVYQSALRAAGKPGSEARSALVAQRKAGKKVGEFGKAPAADKTKNQVQPAYTQLE